MQNRLKETSDEFESVRKKARKAKMDYETIQKERLGFMGWWIWLYLVSRNMFHSKVITYLYSLKNRQSLLIERLSISYHFRYDKFMDAFEHVSQKIDDIYKVSNEAYLKPT